jgi:uncharacterized membrane protein YjgN (DUF898 family)
LTDPTPAFPAAAQSAQTRELPIRFVGSGSEYFRIWIVNLLLTLVTLGLYYPFAKVRRLRYFHGATEVAGAPLSFHGDPWKMFRGYVLVALMLLVYSGAGHFSATAGAIAFVVLAAVWPALWHSSMRFRLANTGWRGLRFRYTGTRGGAYVVMAVPLGLAALAVLGSVLLQPDAAASAPGKASVPAPSGVALLLAVLPGLALPLLLPLFFWLIRRLQHSNYALGPERTRFSASLGSFYGLGFKAIGVSLLAILAVSLAVVVVAALMGAFQDTKAGAVVVAAVGIVVAYPLLFALAGGYWTARLQNLAWGRTASDRLRFTSTLRARSLAALWFKNILLVLLTLGLYFPFAQVASARLRLQAVTVLSDVDPDELAASAGRADETAVGDVAGDLLGFDFGL